MVKAIVFLLEAPTSFLIKRRNCTIFLHDIDELFIFGGVYASSSEVPDGFEFLVPKKVSLFVEEVIAFFKAEIS